MAGAPRDRVRDLGFYYRLRLFAVGVLLAAAIEFGVHLLHEAGYLAKVEDIGADIFVSMQRDRALSDDARPFTFVDIDDATYEAWGEPLPLPRDRIAALIDAAAAAEAHMIVVDIALSGAGSPADAESLMLALDRAYERIVPVVLHRDIDMTPADPASRLPEINPTFIDEAASNLPTVYWAGSLFERSPDWVVRRWRLWQAACAEGVPQMVPSVQLVAWMLEGSGEMGMSGLSSLQDLAPASCAEIPAGGDDVVLTRGGKDIRLAEGAVESRVLFTMPWRPGSDFTPADVVRNGRETPLLEVVPAAAVASGQPISPEVFRDRIVVIGGSYEASRDLYLTPIGPMPGAMLLINAMHTVLSVGALEEPHGGLKWALIFGQIIAAAALFYFLPARAAAWIGVVVVFLTFSLFSQFFLKSGIWIDATLGMIGVLAHRLVASIEHQLSAAARALWSLIRPRQSAVPMAMLAGLLALLLALPVSAQDAALAGRVEWFEGPPDQLSILRVNGAEEAMALFARLNPGDRVVVDGAKGKVTINLVDGSTVDIASGNSPFEIAAVARAEPTPSGGLLAFVGSVLTPWREAEITTISARSRGPEPLTAPLLETGGLKLATGPRGLSLRWHGGTAPFQFRIIRTLPDSKTATIFERSDIAENRASGGPFRLPEGDYSIEITDAAGATVSGKVEVVPPGAIPAIPDDAELATVSPELRRLAEAVFLAGWGKGEWAYEAYLHVTPIAEGYEPARLFRDQLAAGQRPVQH